MSIGTLTYEEAIAELNNPANATKYSTIKGLESLVEQVSVQDPLAASNARTYTYSGELGKGVSTNDLAKAIADSEGTNARIIDRSPAADFLTSMEYDDALELAYGNKYPVLAEPGNEDRLAKGIENYKYDAKNGPWANRSAEFIETAKGPVTNLTPNALENRVWAKTEFSRELSNPDIPEINNIPKQKLIDFKNSLTKVGYSDEKATDLVRQSISVKSHADLANVKYAQDRNGKIVWTDAAVTLANGQSRPIPSTAVNVGAVGDLMKPLTSEKSQTLAHIYEKDLKIHEMKNQTLPPALKSLVANDLQEKISETFKKVDWNHAKPDHPSQAPKLDTELYRDLHKLSCIDFEKAVKTWDEKVPSGCAKPTFVDRNWHLQNEKLRQITAQTNDIRKTVVKQKEQGGGMEID